MQEPEFSDHSYRELYRFIPDLARLRAALIPLSKSHQLAFALCCCERLYPGYQALVSVLHIQDLLGPFLGRLWQHVLGQEMSEPEIAQGMAALRSIPLGKPESCAHFSEAVDALDAVFLTLKACRNYSLDHVVKVAECIRNRIDRPLWKGMAQQMVSGVGPDEQRQIEDVIRSHPTMLAEIEKETAQLRFLYECETLTEEEIANLRSIGRK
ncbi:MAG: DUF416 family protein [Planctomycetes bacterium]|nr:DUF416 family protein [Planctomycetota bacterium]